MALEGKTVVITRPRGQASELAKIITKLGGMPYIVPLVEIRPPRDKRSVTQLVERLLGGQIDYAVFMSVNGVRWLFRAGDALEVKTEMAAALNHTVVVAVGPKTAAELERHTVKVGLTPSKYSAEGIVEALGGADLKGKTVVLARTDKVSPHLRRELEEMGAAVLEITVYDSIPPRNRSRILRLIHDLSEGRVDVMTFTSSAAAQNLFKVAEDGHLVNALKASLKGVVVVAIGPKTKGTLEELGVSVDVVPTEYTVEGMVGALTRTYGGGGRLHREGALAK